MSASLLFSQPAWLWLLIPAMILWGMIGKYRDLRRGLAAVLLILTAAGPVLVRNGGTPALVSLREDGVPGPEVTGEMRFSGSAARALALAGARLRDGGIVKLTGTCHETSGSLASAAAVLARRGIRVEPEVRLPAAGPEGPVLRELRCPPLAGCGETFRITAVLAVPDRRKLELVLRTSDGGPGSHRVLDLSPGESTVELECTAAAPGMHTMSLDIDGRRAAETAFRVLPPYRAVLIADRPETDLAALRRLLNGAAEVELWRPGTDPRSCPLIVISGRGGMRLAAEDRRRVADAVTAGAGLLIFSGRDVPFDQEKLEPGFARLLPVRYTGHALNRTPTTALVVIIDTSGSMSGTRIALARETARLALGRLQDHDLAGIVEFHGRRRWAAPLQSAANRLELRRALNRLNAGGGTVILPAVQEAFYALRNTDARLKHVLILTDGGVEQGDFEGLLRQMARNDITVSTVLVGNGSSPFLARLALWGNGRHYTASSRFALPELSFRQTGRENLTPYREGDLAVECRTAAPPFSAMPKDLRTGGVLESVPVPGAEELLRADGLPFIARKSAGRGSVAAVNTEIEGTWAARFRAAPEASGMLAALARSLPDPVRMHPFAVRDLSVRRDLHLQIETDRPIERLHLTLQSADGTAAGFRLGREGDGAFHFRRSGLAPGRYRVLLQHTPEEAGFAFDIMPFTAWAPGRPTADRKTAAEIARRSALLPAPPPERSATPLRGWFGLAFLACFLEQIRWRRTAGAAVLLLTAILLPLHGGEYEDALRNGLLGRMPAASFRRAVEAAKDPADRRFALLLELENARRTGKLAALLTQWRDRAAADPECLELLTCELDDAGDPRSALEFLTCHAGPSGDRFAPQMIRLAEKCGRTAQIRELAREKMRQDPASPFWLDTAVRLELRNGDRPAAERLLRARIARETDAELLTAIVEAAENAALYPCADAALDRLESLPDTDRWTVRARRIGSLLRRGAPEQARSLVRRYAAEKGLTPGVMMNLADRSERLGDPDTALKLYRQADSEEAAIRRAMLLEGLDMSAEAVEIWRKVVFSTKSEMRAHQAMERILAAEAANGTLSDFCDRLTADLRKDPASARRRFFLCRALAQAGRKDELLRTLDAGGDFETTLHFLLEMKQYGEAVRLLRQKAAGSPAERDDLLRRITVIAVESRDPALARETLDRLLAEASDRAASREFAAGVLMLLDRPDEAAQMYDECLRLAPDAIELHLLRADALKAAGKRDQAIAFFAEKLRGDLPDDLFGIMVDGLLNLEAPAPLLRRALELVRKRIAAAPGSLFHYRLAEDLAEELGDQDLWRKLRTMQLAVAPERRTLLLRSLYEDADLRGDADAACFYARLLTGWQEIYPPELYRSLARTLIDRGLFGVAERCVRQADAAEDSSRRLFALTAVCMEAGRLDDAERICRELLTFEPDSPELRIRHAAVLEMRREYSSSGKENLRALQLLAARQTREKASGRGSDSAAFDRAVQPLLRAFAHQAFLYPEIFDAPLRETVRQAAPAARKRVWGPLLRMLNDLQRLPPVPARTAKEKPRRSSSVPDAERLAQTLVRPGAETNAELCEKVFRQLPPARMEPYLTRLVGILPGDPAPETTAVLRRKIDAVRLPDRLPYWRFLPTAPTLRRHYADRMLRLYPESVSAWTLQALVRSREGGSTAARMLAEEAYERFLKGKTCGFPELRCLRELQKVYRAVPGESEAAGKAARDAVLRSLELGEETPARLLLEAVLLTGGERSDAAFDRLVRSWRGGTRTVVVSRTLEDLAFRTGRWREWLELMEKCAPKDSTVRMLTARRQAQLYRELGQTDRARASLRGLPPVLQRRERLLLDRAALSPEAFAAALGGFLIERSRDGSYIGLYSDDFGLGGIRGLHRRGTLRGDLLPEIGLAADGTTIRGTLEYLILGSPVTSRTLPALLAARRALPPAPPALAAGTASAPQAVLLKAVSGTALLPEDVEVLHRTAIHPRVPETTALICLGFLPETRRATAAGKLAERLIGDVRFRANAGILEKLLPQIAPVRREGLLKRLAAQADELDWRQKGDLLRLVRQFAPGMFEAVKQTFRPELAPMDTELYLLWGAGDFAARFGNYLVCGGEYPDWPCLFAAAGSSARLAEAAETALLAAYRRHDLDDAELVRHFSLLAAADPVRRAHFLALAAQYDRTPGEHSLWRLDATVDPAERRILQTRLREAGRLPPAREQKP